MELDTAIRNLKSYVAFSKCFKKPVITFTEEIETLLTAYEQVKVERDAAVRDIEELIFELRGSSYCERNSKCGTEVCYLRNDGNSCRPRWRGPQQEEATN